MTPALFVALGLGVLPTLVALSDAGADLSAATAALAESSLWARLASSLRVLIATAAVSIPFGLGGAWLLTRSDVPARGPLLASTVVPLFLPPLVHVLSWFGMLGLHGFWAIVLVYVISFTPFVVLLAARAFEQVGRAHTETMLLLGGPVAVLRDDLRQALPAALVGAALASVLLLSDFAVADFLTAVGPKVTVYADSLYALHATGDSAGAAAASIPGVVLALAALAWALRMRRRLGAAIEGGFEKALPLPLGRWRWPAFGLLVAAVAAGTIVPVAVLCWQTGSWTTFVEQAQHAARPIARTLWIGGLAATGMVALALPLAWWSQDLRRPWWLDAAVVGPLAIPALLFGVGLIRVWNRPAFDALYLGAGVVVLALVGRYLAFAYLPLGGAVERLGRGLFEAAEMAGAGRVRRATSVLLPLVKWPLLGAWCVSFCFTLRELDTLVMLRGGHETLTYHLYRNVVFARESEVAALALLTVCVTMAPLVLYFALARRSLRFL